MTHRRFLFLILVSFFLAQTQASAASVASHGIGDPAYRSILVQKAEKLHLADDPYWKILLHYHSRWFGGLKSEIHAKKFFNAPDGRTNPQSELKATLKSFFASPSQNASIQHPQCLFIDRYQWLKSRLHFDPARLPEQDCKAFREWRDTLDPESVTLVFSSYYTSNPSSTFGHTLLRLNHRGYSARERLLDYGVNYAAVVTNWNPLLYGILGLSGGFMGKFSNIPYFVKVAEYNDVESRNLWEYDLNLSQKQIDRLMLHLWTIGHFPTPYYFFNQNCSYMLLGLLDAAAPRLKLAEQFNKLWVIPADTVRAIVRRPGLVKAVRVRPSLAYRIKRERGELHSSEDNLFLKMIHDPSSSSGKRAFTEVENLPSARAAKVWDATLDYIRFLRPRDHGKLPPDYIAFQQKVLAARAALPEKSEEIQLSPQEIERNRPDGGHDTARITLGSGYDPQHRGFLEVGVRPAFHDLNAEDVGYPRAAEIDVLDLEGQYSPNPSRFRLERASLVNIVSVEPWDPVFRKFSWAARIGADPVRDFECDDCIEYKATVGAGFAKQIGRALLMYALARAEVGFGAGYVPGYRLGPAGELGAQLRFSRNMSALAIGSYHYPILGYRPWYSQESIEARVSTSRDTDLRFGYDFYRTTRQGRVLLNVYF